MLQRSEALSYISYQFVLACVGHIDSDTNIVLGVYEGGLSRFADARTKPPLCPSMHNNWLGLEQRVEPGNGVVRHTTISSFFLPSIARHPQLNAWVRELTFLCNGLALLSAIRAITGLISSCSTLTQRFSFNFCVLSRVTCTRQKRGTRTQSPR